MRELVITLLFCNIVVYTQTSQKLIFDGETNFSSVKQLTNGGENAEAYFSFDEKMLCYQARDGKAECDQIYVMNIDGSGKKRISSGKGKTTCSYFLPNGNVLYATTVLDNEACPPPPDMSQGYVWQLNETFDIVIADTASGKIVKRLTRESNYDAEATVSPVGDKIVFTSIRTGDIELYSCDIDGKNVKQLTNELGYDGGAFFSFDGTKIVYRASRPIGDDSLQYTSLLGKHMIKPKKLEIFVMNSDGSGKKQITNNGKANFAPFFHPDGKRVIFSSNMDDVKGRNFDLYMVNIDGTGLKRITNFEGFDGFPMFTRDGKKLVFCSNRNNEKPGETNVFMVDWKE